MGRHTVYLALLGGALMACGDGGSGPDGETDPNLVPSSAFQYAEGDDAANSTHGTAEDTTYTLDAIGMAISGSFEASAASSDYYLISTGPYSGLDLRVFVNGVRMPETSGELTTSVDAQIDDGYEPAEGNDLTAVWVAPQMKYLIGIVPFGASGKSYVIQVKGH